MVDYGLGSRVRLSTPQPPATQFQPEGDPRCPPPPPAPMAPAPPHAYPVGQVSVRLGLLGDSESDMCVSGARAHTRVAMSMRGQ